MGFKLIKNLFAILLITLCSFSFFACGEKENVVRIHIRANSNSEVDQEVKLKVRDEVITFITPLLASCNDSEDVKIILSENLNNLEKIADKVLLGNGFNYVSNASIRYEYFPSRDYDGTTFPADYYDALIIELGSGTGDNWWCVAYPPLCFIGKDAGNNSVKYKSKILELINKYFG
ncbi:MAG: stage II sporulation protein R [Christensenellales bacterium]